MSYWNENERKSFVETLRIALATSIIRSKPEHLSAQEYTRQIATKLKASQDLWKTKYENVRKDLEKAKQEIVLLKLQSNQCTESLEDHLNSIQDCNIGEPNNCYLSVVVNFRSLCKKVHDDEESLEMIKQGMVKAMKDMELSLKSVGIDKRSMKYLEINVTLLTDMLKNEKFSTDKKIMKITSAIIRTIVTLLMNSQEEYPVKERIINCLSKLSRSCAIVRDVVIDTLVLVVRGYTSLLKELRSFSSLNTYKFDSVGYVCELLKDVVSTCSKWPLDRLYDYSQSLDEDLLELSSTFMLYAQTVWTISSFMMEVMFNKETVQSNEDLSID